MFRSTIILLFLVVFAFQIGTANSSSNKGFLGDKFFAKYKKEFVTLTGAKSESRGEISYLYPGKLILKQITPFESQLVTNGEKAWYYNAPFDPETEKGEVTISKAKDLPLTEVLDALKNGLVDCKLYKVKSKKETYELTLEKSFAEKIDLLAVKLVFKNEKDIQFSNLDKLIIVKKDKTEEDYKFEKLNVSPSFSSENFVFKIPEGTKINQ